MLTAEEARLQSKSKIKEWVANDLEYLNNAVVDTIAENDETFVSVDMKYLHKDAVSEVLKELTALGYKAHVSEKALLLQWGKPATPKAEPQEVLEEDEEDPFNDDDNDDSYDDDL